MRGNVDRLQEPVPGLHFKPVSLSMVGELFAYIPGDQEAPIFSSVSRISRHEQKAAIDADVGR